MTQPSLLDDIQRIEKPWKVARRVSRAAFWDAEQRGLIEHRREIVGRVLRYIWNSTQKSATSKQIANWIIAAKKDWPTKERTWIHFETRRALDDLRKLGLADSEDRGGKFLYWRWRSAGEGERRAS